MPFHSWLDFEERYRRLAPKLQYARIDDQTGAAGEHWRIAGGPFDPEAIREFETISAVAGKRLSEVAFSNEELKSTLDHEDPRIRWWRFLKSRSASYEIGLPAYQADEDGNNLGWIHSGTINNICEGCANLCLELEASMPIKRPISAILYEDYGKQLIIGFILLLVGAMIGAWFT